MVVIAASSLWVDVKTKVAEKNDEKYINFGSFCLETITPSNFLSFL